jgi:hypothetical protein
LKKVEGRWKAVAPLIFGGNSENLQPLATKEST